MAETPVCTCIRRALPDSTVRIAQVLDPFCQIPAHSILGSCAEPPPYPPKETKNP
jgi:hypothetical protein